MERTNDKASRLISGESLTGDHSRDDFIFLVLARNYTGGDPGLMKDLFLMTPLNRIGSGQKRRDDRKYMDYLEKTIDKVLRLGSFKNFDWSNHFDYKERTKAMKDFKLEFQEIDQSYCLMDLQKTLKGNVNKGR